MTKELAQNLVNMFNSTIDNYMNEVLPVQLGLKKNKNGEYRASANDWFRAQRFINEQNFYHRGMAVLELLRAEGFDCKMNMQDHKLVL